MGSGDGERELALVRELLSVIRLGGLEVSLDESASRKLDMRKFMLFLVEPMLFRLL